MVSMFVKRCMDRLIGWDRNEIILIKVINGISVVGMLFGMNSFRKLNLCCIKLYRMMVSMMIMVSVKVMMMWLVIVKKYGNMLNRLVIRMNVNMENVSGKNCILFVFVVF